MTISISDLYSEPGTQLGSKIPHLVPNPGNYYPVSHRDCTVL